jgi:hypothetical protein
MNGNIDGKLTGKYLGDIWRSKERVPESIAEKHISTKLLPWVMVLMICLCWT